MEARIAGCLSSLQAAEEGFEGAVHTLNYVLQGLTVYFSILRHGLFDARQLGFLLIVADGDATQTPCLQTLANRGIVDVAAKHQGPIKQPLLFGSRLEFILKGLSQGRFHRFHAARPVADGPTPLRLADQVPGPCAHQLTLR
jgi:hypothetical protein